MKRWVLPIVMGMLALACNVPIPTSQPLTIIEPVDRSESVGLEGATRAEVSLRMLNGTLTLAPGDVELVQADFHYNVQEWEPEVKAETDGEVRKVSLSQGLGSELTLGEDEKYVNAWTVTLARGVPMKLNVALGSGKATLALGGLSLSGCTITTGKSDTTISFDAVNPEPLSTLRLTTGMGDVVISGLGNANFDRLVLIGGTGGVDLDFSGAWSRSALAEVTAGTGGITLRVPASLGARVTFSGTPVTSVDAVGFTETEDNVYTNDAYGSAALTLTIKLAAGLGKVMLISQ